VVLFDEIEKAHPDVFNVLLQLMDDGRLTDSQGRVVDFRNTVVIMTSNIGSHLMVDAGPIASEAAWEQVEQLVLAELRKHFRPEFLNRVDDVVVFHPLSPEHIARIVTLQIARLNEMVEAKGLRLTLTSAAQALIAEKGYDPIYGARPLKRVIQRLLQNPIANAILAGDFGPGDAILVDRQGDALSIGKAAAPAERASA
jgi:ATP-dependent Clp protease ATP-binding subunit ClpB